MRLSLNARIRTQEQAGKRRWTGLFAGAILLAAVVCLLYIHIGFALYAVTGLLWTRTSGVVLDEHGYTAVVEFTTEDGAAHQFREDYNLICGSRYDFCWMRSFARGQVVPVVYDARVPTHAFIHDWALYAAAISFFVEAILGLLLAWMVLFILIGKPGGFSIRFGQDSEAN